MPHPSSRISGIVLSGKDGWEVHSAAQRRRQAGEPIVMLSIGDHDFHTPAATIDAGVEALRGGHHHYTPLAGLPRLRDAMAAVSSRATGLATGTDEVIATSGGQAGLFAAIMAVLDPGGHAVVVAPYYATYPGTFRAAGAGFTIVETRPADGFQPDVERIEAALEPNTRAVLINTPNNPTGAIYTRESLEALAELCIRRDLWLISDEVYWSITGGRPHRSPRSLPGMAERTIVINSMSKSHGMTGWRIGWLTAPAELVAWLTDLNLVTTYGLPDFISHAAAEALEKAYGVSEIADRYEGRRQVFLRALGTGNDIVVRGSEGGMFVMLDISAIEPDCETFAWDLLERERIAVMPGSSFGEAASGHIRISLCQPDDILRDAAIRLKRFAADYGTNKARMEG